MNTPVVTDREARPKKRSRSTTLFRKGRPMRHSYASNRSVVVITGGSSGIGRALVLKYAKEGYTVVFTGRNEERIEEVKERLRELEATFLALRLDVSSMSDNEKLIQATMDRFGRIDVLICNAGISMRALFEEAELKVFEKVMDVNFRGALYPTKYALPHLIASKGTIIGISSINGWRGTPARTAYTASKYAMQGFFEALRTEVMQKGVHVLVACPGFTGTNIRKRALSANGIPQSESPYDEDKLMRAEEVAEHIFVAMKRKKRDLILTTQGRFAVFLNKWFPRVMDRVVYRVMAREPHSPVKSLQRQ